MNSEHHRQTAREFSNGFQMQMLTELSACSTIVSSGMQWAGKDDCQCPVKWTRMGQVITFFRSMNTQ